MAEMIGNGETRDRETALDRSPPCAGALAPSSPRSGWAAPRRSPSAAIPIATTFSTGGNCGPREVATDAAGNVYVACADKGLNGLYGSIRKFSPSGSPLNFTANQPYIEGNEINEDPGPNTTGFERPPQFGMQTMLAVDRSNSLRSGYIYADTGNATGNVDIFDPTGKYVTSFKSSPGMEPTGVGVGPDGYVYVMWEGIYGRISKYNPETYLEVERINTTNGEGESLSREGVHRPLLRPHPARTRPEPCGPNGASRSSTANSKGGASASGRSTSGRRNCSPASAPTPSRKPASSRPTWTKNTKSKTTRRNARARRARMKATKKRCSLEGHMFDVDPKTNELYRGRDRRRKDHPLQPGRCGRPRSPERPGLRRRPPRSDRARALAIDNSGNVYTTIEPNKVAKFTTGATLPNVLSKPTAIADQGHTEATVRGVIDPAGGGEITSCKVAWGETAKHTEPARELQRGDALSRLGHQGSQRDLHGPSGRPALPLPLRGRQCRRNRLRQRPDLRNQSGPQPPDEAGDRRR